MAETKVISETDREKAPEIKKSTSSFMRMTVLVGKTWKDIFSLKSVVISSIVLAIIPVLLTWTKLKDSALDEMSPYAAGMTIAFDLIPFMYLLTIGIIYGIKIGSTSSGLICEEVEAGTMLILVSKPIGRIQIFLGKFIAAFIYLAIIAAVSIFLTSWTAVLLITGNLQHFIVMIPVLNFLFVYSLFVNVVFLSISMALSSIMKKGKKVSALITGLILLTFLGFFLIKLSFASVYNDYNLIYLDIGHHLGNTFLFLNNLMGAPLPLSESWQGLIGAFSGIFEAETMELLMAMLMGSGSGAGSDSAQGIDLGGYFLRNFFTPTQSFLIWIGITVLLVLFGLMKLKKREITN